MTRLVEIGDFIKRHEGKRTSSTFHNEIKAYLKNYPHTRHVDILLNDLNGIFRGKRIAVDALAKLEQGCYFPASVFTMDILGNSVEEAGIGRETGDPDYLCFPVAGTLVPSAVEPDTLAQLLLTMCSPQGQPFMIEPRNVLNMLWQQLCQRGLFPVVAVELEFYLVDNRRDANGQLRPPVMPGSKENNEQNHLFSVDHLDDFSDVLRDINEMAVLQGIAAQGALAEASPGQFEINLLHSPHVLTVCDHVLRLKRLIRQVAQKHALNATFMAKPYEKFAGSGMHVHISMQDAAGRNLFATPENVDSSLLKRVLGGLLDLMPASMTLLAPNVNAWRRFVPDAFVPLHACWGYNNRNVALRVPCADVQNRRVEYRVAGADANPYLVIATIFAGILHGLDCSLSLPPPVRGNECLACGALLPRRQSDALALFARSDALQRRLGKQFSFVWHRCKSRELTHFERMITATEIDWMLKNI